MSSPPQVATITDLSTIRRDSEGRFCLNDLHKAAGGEDRHGPDRFFRTDAGGGLLLALANSPEMANKDPLSSSRGRYGGTYVVKELVYAYAMWVSPAFHLKVIRFFDRGVKDGVAVADHAAMDVLNDPLGFMEKVFAQARVFQAERDRLDSTDALLLELGNTQTSNVRLGVDTCPIVSRNGGGHITPHLNSRWTPLY